MGSVIWFFVGLSIFPILGLAGIFILLKVTKK
jgi:hypothetical protein